MSNLEKPTYPEIQRLNDYLEDLYTIKRWLSDNPFGQEKLLVLAEEDLNSVILKLVNYKDKITT